MFRTMLAYKLAERGGLLAEVPARNTSRTCAECGVVDAASRSGQRFRCTACGHEAHPCPPRMGSGGKLRPSPGMTPARDAPPAR